MIQIEYCGMWNYFPRAVGLADKIKKQLKVEVELIRGSGGVFEIFVKGIKIYSKKETGEFPVEEEALTLIKKALE